MLLGLLLLLPSPYLTWNKSKKTCHHSNKNPWEQSIKGGIEGKLGLSLENAFAVSWNWCLTKKSKINEFKTCLVVLGTIVLDDDGVAVVVDIGSFSGSTCLWFIASNNWSYELYMYVYEDNNEISLKENKTNETKQTKTK